MLVTNLANSSLIWLRRACSLRYQNRPTVNILRSWDIPRSKETDYAGVVLVVAELPGRGLVHGVTLPFTER